MAIGDLLTESLDSFNRTDEDPLATSSSGGTWSTETWLGSNSWTVSSNELADDGSAGGNSYGTIAPDDDIEVAYMDTTMHTSADVILFWRMTDWGMLTVDGYSVNFKAGYFQFKRWDNGVPFVLASGTPTGGSGASGILATGDHIMGRAVGNTIGVYAHDGTSWNLMKSGSSVTDTNYPNAGYVGIYTTAGDSFTANYMDWYGGAAAGPAYKAVGTTDRTAGNTSLAPAYPTTVDADDYAVLSIAKQAAHTVGTITDANQPPNWTLIGSGDEVAVYGRKCDGAEDSDTVTIALSGGSNDDEAVAQITTFSEVNTSDPHDATATTATDTGTAVSTGTLTPDNDNALIVHVVGSAKVDGAAPTIGTWAATDPATLTERVDVGS